MEVRTVQAGIAACADPARTGAGKGGFDAFPAGPKMPETLKEAFAQVFRQAYAKAAETGQGRADAPAVDGKQGQAYAKAAETGQGRTQTPAEEGAPSGRMDYQKFLQEKIKELYERFKRGEFEPSYQIGAASFTEKEWDKLLEKFDALSEEIRIQMRKEQEERAQQQQEQAIRQKEKTEDDRIREQREAAQVKTGEDSGAAQDGLAQDMGLLSGMYTTAVYPADKEEDGEERYVTCYTADGIYCRKAGQGAGYEWKISFEHGGEYEKVTELIGRFPQDMNLRFASHENFWEDFLGGHIDLDGFMKFMEGTDGGVPDYTVTIGDSTFIDREKAKWAKYMNRGSARFYTAQEMQRMQEELIRENTKGLRRL